MEQSIDRQTIALDKLGSPTHNNNMMIDRRDLRSLTLRHTLLRNRATLAIAALAFMAALAGCGEDEYKQPVKKEPVSEVGEPTVAAAPTTIPVPPLPSTDLRADLGITTERYGDYSNRDLVEKADIFWKLFYMTKALQEGHPPPDVASALQALKAGASKLHPDKNVAAIETIIKEVDTGLAAKALEERLSQRGIRTASLSWSGGSYDLTRELKAPSTGRVSELDRKPAASSEDVRLAAEFAGRNHKPPMQVQQECFQRATELTGQLGDTLDDERKQSGEHPIGRDKVDPSSGLANPYASMFPSNPIR